MSGGDDRGAAMARSVEQAARTHGVVGTELLRLRAAHALAMEPRVAAFDDDHHPAYLHPGRTVLILLRDAGTTDGPTLAAAALAESLDEGLRADPERIRQTAGGAVAELLAELPRADRDDVAERLVTAPEELALVALAERLDHLRHAHLRDDLDWAALHAEAVELWGPVAARTHPQLARRYEHWIRSFAKRLRR